MKKRPYKEGTIFAVPLPNGGYARGVIARTSKKGGLLFGYFFGPRIEQLNQVDLSNLSARHAIYSKLFGDLGLIKEDWPLVGSVSAWDRSHWPLPDFVRQDDLGKKAWLVRYSDDDLNQIEAEYPIEYPSQLPRNGLAGYGFVESKLDMMIGPADKSACVSDAG